MDPEINKGINVISNHVTDSGPRIVIDQNGKNEMMCVQTTLLQLNISPRHQSILDQPIALNHNSVHKLRP
jgi:hypothetical protein